MKKITLKKEEIDALFDEGFDPETAIIGIFKLVYPDWDNVKSIDGFVKCSKEFNEYIYELIGNGGMLWMNYGFSSFDSDLKGFEVMPASYIVNDKAV